MRLRIMSCLARPGCYISLPQDTVWEGLGWEAQNAEKPTLTAYPLQLNNLAVAQAPGEPRDREKTQTGGRHLEGQTRDPQQGQPRTKLFSNDSSVLGTGGVLPMNILIEQISILAIASLYRRNVKHSRSHRS